MSPRSETERVDTTYSLNTDSLEGSGTLGTISSRAASRAASRDN